MVLLACSPPSSLPTRPFPEGFLFGAATAGFQVEAGCPEPAPAACTDMHSDWYQFATDPELVAQPGLFLSGDPLSEAPGHYSLFPEDLVLAAQIGANAFRFSFEWSRLFPDGAAENAVSVDDLAALADPEALAYYRRYLDAIAAEGLTPVATLNHYTLPLWVHDAKACHFDPQGCAASGWMDPDRIIPLITTYSAFVARTFGPDITRWLTLNEPLAVAIPGFGFQTQTRTNPPGISDIPLAIDTIWAMAQAHGQMAQAIHDEDPDAQVGIVFNAAIPVPDDPTDPEDLEAVEHMDYIYNTLFIEAYVNGQWDSNLDGTLDTSDPRIAGQTDFIGLNYYNVVPVNGFSTTIPLPGASAYPLLDFLPSTLDIIDLSAIDQAIDRAALAGLPVLVTETGLPNPTEADTAEITAAFSAVHSRLDEHEVTGFLYWSLIDNYEWNHGMDLRFGLYAVDDQTKARSLRPIGQAFADIAIPRALP